MNNNKHKKITISEMKNYIFYAAAALALASCSSEEPVPAQDGELVAASFSADIAGVKSRAYDTSWESGDQIGISCSSANGKTEYANMTYETTGDGVFAHVGGKATGIFFQDTEDVTFSAYYPFSGTEGSAAGVLSGSTADQSQQKKFDYLFAKDAVGSRNASAISFTAASAFSHCMTRLVITVKVDPNAGFTPAEVTNGTFALQGLKLNGTFDTATGLAQATGTASADFWTIPATVDATGETMQNSIILYPQTVDELKYRVIIDNEEYFATISPALTAGTSYSYTVTVKKQGLEVTSATINDWNNSPEGDVDAEM